MRFKKHNPGCMCCADCWEWADNFDRGDSTDLGADWTEVTGNWGISSNHLVECYTGGGTATAKVISTQKCPSPNEMSVSVKILDPQENDTFRIYIALYENTSTEPYAEFQYLGDSASPNWRVSVHADGQTDSKDMLSVAESQDGLDAYTVSACIEPWAWEDDDKLNRMCCLWARIVSSDEYPWLDSVAVPDEGVLFGLGHNNTTNGAKFDNIYVYELVAGTTVCMTCFCRCDYHTPLKKTLTLTFTNCSGDATCLSGDTIDLEWDWNAGAGSWYGEREYNWDHGDHTFKWRLACGTYNPETPFQHLSLTMEPGQVCCSVACDVLYPDPDTSECEGLSLVFGPYSLTGLTCFVCDHDPLDSLSGQYYVTVTQ